MTLGKGTFSPHSEQYMIHVHKLSMTQSFLTKLSTIHKKSVRERTFLVPTNPGAIHSQNMLQQEKSNARSEKLLKKVRNLP